jgi:hypothetical protein
MQDKTLLIRITLKCYCKEMVAYTEMQTNIILPCSLGS